MGNEDPQNVYCISNNKIANLTMFMSCFCWVTGYVYSNQHRLHPVETNLSRSVCLILISYTICRLQRKPLDFKSPTSFQTLCIRHIIFCVHGVVVAGVQFYLPLPITHTIGSMGPIFILIIQFLFYSMQITQKQCIAVMVAFVGLALTSNGRQLTKMIDPTYKFTSDFANYLTDGYQTFIITCLIYIVNTVFWAYAVTLTQKANTGSFEIIYHFGISNMLFSSFGYLFLSNHTSTSVLYWAFVFVGVPLALAETSFTVALNFSSNVGLTTIVGFSTVLISYFISVVKYKQGINLICAIGTILVLGAVWVIILSPNEKKNQQEDTIKQ